MAKILLVEDDNNLREIYEARLQAEGYEIVSARDGEEALTIAMKERPDLIISDVMMPKISGFDMLDIIRSTEETKNAKVIMMTALSQAEDKARAEKLGADRYLVKSQVTLEDVAKVAREVLSGVSPTTAPALQSTPTPVVSPVVTPVVPAPTDTSVSVAGLNPTVATPAADNPALASIMPAAQNDSSVPAPTAPKLTATNSSGDDDEQSAIAKQIESFIDSNKEDTNKPEGTAPVVPVVLTPAPISTPDFSKQTTASVEANNPALGKKIIEPIKDGGKAMPDLNDLLKKEEEKEKMTDIAKQIVEKNEVQTSAEASHPELVASEIATPAPSAVPASTGTNMDGVIQQPSPAPAQNDLPADDPNNISL